MERGDSRGRVGFSGTQRTAEQTCPGGEGKQHGLGRGLGRLGGKSPKVKAEGVSVGHRGQVKGRGGAPCPSVGLVGPATTGFQSDRSHVMT